MGPNSLRRTLLRTCRILFPVPIAAPIALAGLTLLLSPLAARDALAIDCPTNCNDFNACTIDSCDTTTGTCRYDPANCDDHNPCTTDSCLPGLPGLGCLHAPLAAGTVCSDGNSCTLNDACTGGSSSQCVGQAQPSGTACDDGNSCTASDTCDASNQCVGTPLSVGTACDDHSQCTNGDTCQSGPGGSIVCTGAPKDCGDGDLCTQDKCDPSTGVCSHPPVDCDDRNSCTADSCDPATGECIRTNVSGPCNDGNACTPTDSCSGGNCIPGGSCDDHVDCTDDLCADNIRGCIHITNNSRCNDNNVCTRDTCLAFGCNHTALSGGPCPYPNPCFSGICGFGSCGQGPPIPCSDNNPCTVDTCDPTLGCQHAPQPPGAPCSDNNPCTLNDTCDASGVCGGQIQPIGSPCDDGNLCTTGDSCVQGSGGSTVCQGSLLNCDDHNACTNDFCLSFSGCGHEPRLCMDGDACTADSCDPAVGCVFTPLSQITCGVGVCQRTITCPGTCIPGTGSREVCNGLDDNCDGQVDEFLNTPVTCGVGACQRTVNSCDNGVPQTCTPGTPSPEVCNGIDDDCDGQVDEGAIQVDCKISPDTLNLNGQGSLLSFDCKLTDGCDPNNLVPIPGIQVDQVYISRADSAATSGDDVVLPNPFTAPCPDPTLGTAYEPGIVEDTSARQNGPKGATFKFDVASDGVCTTLDGDRQDLLARLTAIPDSTNATVCITGRAGVTSWTGCVDVLVKNHGLR